MKQIIQQVVKPGMICETFSKDVYVALNDTTWFCASNLTTKSTNEIYYLGRKLKNSGKIIAKRKNQKKDWEIN